MRRVRAPRRVVDEPRLRLILGPNRVQPPRSLVGQVVRKVVLLPVLPGRNAQRRVVLRDDRIELTRLAAEEAPEVIEAPAGRPPVERACRPLDVVRGQMPLAEAGGAVAVALERPDERRAVLGQRRRVAGERPWQLADRAEADAVVIASAEEGCARGRADRRHVKAGVTSALLRDSVHGRSRHGTTEGRGIAEAGIVEQHEQHVRRALGRRRSHVDRPVRDRLVERAPDRPAEVRIGDRQHGPVGAELPHRLGERLLQRTRALLVALDDREELGTLERLLDREPLLVVEHGDDARRPRRQVLADLVVDLVLDSVVDELADHAACDRADSNGREHRRREKTDREPDATAPARSLAADGCRPFAERRRCRPPHA